MNLPVDGECLVVERHMSGKGGRVVKEKVQEVINKVRPFLQRDGGDVELVGVEPDGLVKVRLKGACGG